MKVAPYLHGGGPQNWPPRSPGTSPLDFHVWGLHKKNVVYERKVDTRAELLQQLCDAERRVNDTPQFVASIHLPESNELGRRPF
jgi:hypothetical protein